MSGAQVIQYGRSQDFQRALETLLSREDEPEIHPDGLLRMGNVMDLARFAGCGEGSYQLRMALDIKGVTYGQVEDSLISEVCMSLGPQPCGVPDVMCEEIRAMIDLAEAAGLKEEAEWMRDHWEENWNFGPIPLSA